MSEKQKSGKYKQLLLNIGIFSLSSILSKAVMFFLLPLYTNILSTSEYGIVELIMTGINLLTPVLTLSISDAVVRFGLDSKIPHGKVFKAETVALCASSVIMILCFPLIHLYKPLSDYTTVFICSMIVLMFRSNYVFFLKSIERNKLFAIDSILYTIILASTNILFLAVLHLGIYGYMLSLIVANIFSIIFVLIVGKGLKALRDNKFDKRLLRSMLLYSAPMIFNALSWWITNSSDKYMLEYYWSSAEVGIYSAAAKIPALISTVNALFSQAWTLSSVKEYEEGADKGFFKNIFSTYSSIMFLSAALILIAIKPFMHVYVGADFLDSWYYVPALLLAALFGCFSNYFGSIYIAAKQNIRCTISTIICGIINILLNFILIPKYGIWGATVATAVSFIVVGVYRMIDCQKILYFPIDYKKYTFASLLILCECIIIVSTELRYVISVIIILLLLYNYNAEIKSIINSSKIVLAKKR